MRPACFDCGQLSDHDHHVVPQSKGGTKTVPLCVKCHSLVHSHPGLATSALTKEGIERRRAAGLRVGPLRKYSDAQNEEVVRLRALGRSYTAIKKLTGMSLGHIANVLWRRAVGTRNKP